MGLFVFVEYQIMLINLKAQGVFHSFRVSYYHECLNPVVPHKGSAYTNISGASNSPQKVWYSIWGSCSQVHDWEMMEMLELTDNCEWTNEGLAASQQDPTRLATLSVCQNKLF